jgi:hypothetical protein
MIRKFFFRRTKQRKNCNEQEIPVVTGREIGIVMSTNSGSDRSKETRVRIILGVGGGERGGG